MTQCDILLKWFAEGKTISNLEALVDLGIGRLPSRIHDLKRRGYHIGECWEESINRRGDKCRFKRYYIINDKQ